MGRRKSEPPDTERLVILREARERKKRKRLDEREDMAAKEARAQAEADAWNARHPVGCDVEVTKDDGSRLVTITRASAAVVGAAAVVWVVGIVGCYALERVRVIQTTQDAGAELVADAMPGVRFAELAAERERIYAAAGNPPDALELPSTLVTLPEDVAVGQRYEVRGETWEVTEIGVDGTQAAAVVKLDAAGERTATTDTVWYGELRNEARRVA